jgi:hypothetical protein
MLPVHLQARQNYELRRAGVLAGQADVGCGLTEAGKMDRGQNRQVC